MEVVYREIESLQGIIHCRITVSISLIYSCTAARNIHCRKGPHIHFMSCCCFLLWFRKFRFKSDPNDLFKLFEVANIFFHHCRYHLFTISGNCNESFFRTILEGTPDGQWYADCNCLSHPWIAVKVQYHCDSETASEVIFLNIMFSLTGITLVYYSMFH